MSRRLDVELTSAREDGSWTWRAVGAREPRGAVDGALVPGGAKVGDELRAEADFDLDGVTIVSLAPKQEKKRNEAERIELIGRPQRDDQLVTSTLTSRSGGDRRDRRDRRDRGERGERGDRPDRGPRDRKPREGAGTGTEREGRPPRERTPRPDRSSDRPPRADRPPRTAERRPPRSRPETPAKPKPKRLRPGRAHRNAVLDELPPEHRPIAEQVLAGDIPAVRQAIDKENETRTAAGQPTINGAELLALAEKLRPRLRTAEWRDRAEAALAAVDEVDLRDLRSVVVAADNAARDDETRALATQLREGLTKRVEAEQATWRGDLTTALDEGRVVRALRLSSRPPKAGTILDPALSTRLTEGASASLTAEAGPDRWAAVLDATAFSPVRLTVKPQSIPAQPSDELLEVIKRFGSRVPLVAEAFGIDTSSLPARPKAPRRPKKPVPPPPAREKAKPEPQSDAPAENVEEIERPAEDDVPAESVSADVPTGDGESTPDDGGTPPVVLGVPDEDDVAPE
jgi:hypothetical protein